MQKPPLGRQLHVAHPLAHGLVGCWLFNEGSGDLVHDSSGNENHGTFKNMTPATDWVTGEDGPVLNLDGVNDFVSLGISSGLYPSSAITIALRVRHRIINTSQTYYSARVHNGSEVCEFRLYNTGLIAFEFKGFGEHAFKASGAIAASIWEDIAVSHVWGTGSQTRLYRGGQAFAGSWVAGDGNVALPAGTPGDVEIGSIYYTTPGQYNHFDGDISHVCLWDRALCAEEVAELHG